jgi:hypothetical protein
LQPGVICVLKKEQMQKKHETVIATKKQLQNTQVKKCVCKKTSSKRKSSIT